LLTSEKIDHAVAAIEQRLYWLLFMPIELCQAKIHESIGMLPDGSVMPLAKVHTRDGISLILTVAGCLRQGKEGPFDVQLGEVQRRSHSRPIDHDVIGGLDSPIQSGDVIEYAVVVHERMD